MITRIAAIMLLLVVNIYGYSQNDVLKNKILTSEEARTDFNYYRRLLQETHPGLYRYSSNEKMKAKLDSLYNSLDKPIPFYEFYKILTALISEIRCAHTNALPTNDFRKYLYQDIKTLPFFLFPVQDRLYVIFNGSTDNTIKLGYELIKINGHPIDSITKILKHHYWADGYIESSKNAVLQGGLFCVMYYAIIEKPETFNLIFKDIEGKEFSAKVSAQFYGESEKRYSKGDINKKANGFYNTGKRKPWRLSFPKDMKSVAVLRFDAFGGEGAHDAKEAQRAINKFMEESIKEINLKRTAHLIVDVRSNPGGWDSQGIELLTYLVPFDSVYRHYRKPHAITDRSEFLKFSDLSEEDLKNVKNELTREADGIFTMREEENSDLKLQHPKPNRFKGKIYVLMDSRSASTASEFLAVAKSHRIGVFVGTESGGVYEGGNGGSYIHLDLPHSKIRVGTPLLYYNNAVDTPQQKGRGTFPDHEVYTQPTDLLTNFDRQLEFVKALIRKSL